MRAAVVCLLITFVVLLALPETTPAPACDDKVLSMKTEKENSKSSEKLAQQGEESTESKTRSANGLESGAKTNTQTKQLSEKEEEESRTATEKKTATGTETVEESVKKKKEVTVSEKKTVMIYYLVSYKRLPDQEEGECRVDYYKRVFPKENNLNVFYRKLFKAYEDEAPKAYTDRIEFIFNKVYPELDCRLDVDWLEFFDHYYTLKYSRKIEETDESYFPRVLKKEEGEDKEHYQKRMDCLVAAIDEEDFTHITFDDSAEGFKIGKRETPAKSQSSPSSSGEPVLGVSSTSSKSKSKEESVDKSEKTKQEKSKKGTCSQRKKKTKKRKAAVEKEENTKSFAYRVAYDKLPKRPQSECLEKFYKRYFGECNAKMSPDELYQLYFRILIMYRGESLSNYVDRIDFLFDKVYPQLDIRADTQRISLLEHYYVVKYGRRPKESDEQWLSRILTKLTGETEQHYKNRVECLKQSIKEAKWDKVVIDAASSTGFRLLSIANAVKNKITGGGKCRCG